MLLRAIMLACRQLVDAATLRLLVQVIGLTLLIFALSGTLLWLAVDAWVTPRWIAPDSSYATLAGLGVAVLLLVAFWLLFRVVAMAVMGLFTDGIVASVEEDHYPAAAARAVTVSFAAGVRLGLRSAGRALVWNLLATPLYLALLFTGIGLPIALLLVNAALLGRDLEEMVAARHPGADGEQRLPRRLRWTLGLVTALAFLVPVLNLVAPVFGAALAVHLFHFGKDFPA